MYNIYVLRFFVLDMKEKSNVNPEMTNIEQRLQARRMEYNQLRRTLMQIYNTLWVHVTELIDDGWPNDLVPQGLIYNEASGKLFEHLKNKWVKFYLDSDKKTEKWYSDKNGKYIFLWLKTPRHYTKNMWIPRDLDESQKTQLVFLHEMCHHLARELIENNEYFQKLFKICMSLRRECPQNWVSGLAGMNFYQSRWLNAQVTEDCVELLRIYFMCRKDESNCFECIKSKLHLRDDTACKTIFNLLSESVMYTFPTR